MTKNQEGRQPDKIIDNIREILQQDASYTDEDKANMTGISAGSIHYKLQYWSLLN